MALNQLAFVAHNMFTGPVINIGAGPHFSGEVPDSDFHPAPRNPDAVDYDYGVQMEHWDYTQCWMGYPSETYRWNTLRNDQAEAIRLYYEQHKEPLWEDDPEAYDPTRPDLTSGSRYWIYHFNGEKAQWEKTSAYMQPPEQDNFPGGGDVVANFQVRFARIGFDKCKAQDSGPVNYGFDWFGPDNFDFVLGDSD